MSRVAFFVICGLVAIGSVLGKDPIAIEPDGSDIGGGLDLSDSDLTTQFCESKGKECKGGDIESTFASTTGQCLSRCSRNLECLSVFYDSSKNCHLRKNRCSDAQLVSGSGNEYYRLKKGESCPGGMKPYEEEAKDYSNLFCMVAGKACPGHNLYKKPQNIKPWDACLKKCLKIKTCGMVDFHTDTNKACEPMAYQCTPSELVDRPGTVNYIRLEKGQTTCTGGWGESGPPEEATAPPPTEAPTEAPPPELPNSCIYENTLHAGLDLKGGYAASADKCRTDCIANKQCHGSTHDKWGNCWLHYAIEEGRIKGGNAKATLFRKECPKEETTDKNHCSYYRTLHAGLDMRGGYYASVDQCKRDCETEKRCAGSTHDIHGLCWLHAAIEEGRIKQNKEKATLFRKDCPASCSYKDTLHAGLDLKGGYKASADKCRTDCIAEPKCMGSTHDKANLCWLHHNIEEGRIRPGSPAATLFRKYCPGNQDTDSCVYLDTVHGGQDIGGSGYTASQQKCTADCLARADCVGSTHDKANKCWLHHTIKDDRILPNHPQATFFRKHCNPACTYGSTQHAGLDIKGGYHSTIAQCRVDCLAEPRCQGSTHDPRNLCWLHYGIEAGRIRPNKPGMTFFRRHCPGTCTLQNTQHAGLDIGGGFAVSVDQCREYCLAEPRCHGSTHDPRNLCWLHYGLENGRIRPNRPGYTLFKKFC